MAGIYIHIPFCKKACTYCDFHFSTSLKYADDMIEAICKEIRLKSTRLSGQTVGSIYFGGGTPSVLPVESLDKIIHTLTSVFTIAGNAEITIEANPDDLDQPKITALKQLPVNRFSIGIQSFFEEDLRWMNRAHTAREAENCVKRSQDTGFENLSLDLIYGYPLLTDTKWQHNIHTALAFGVPHISAYALTVEGHTALAHAISHGKQPPMNDEQSAAQFQYLSQLLCMAGFEHYEISNYSKPGCYAVHNTNYWKGIPYLGIGPSAHGFDGAIRYANIANNAKYLQALSEGQLPETIEMLSATDRYNEYIMTTLRTQWGIDLHYIREHFGPSYANHAVEQTEALIHKGWLIRSENSIILSTEGKLYADGAAAQLFLESD